MATAEATETAFISRDKVLEAVKALKQIIKDYADKEKGGSRKKLFEVRDMFFVTLALQKAPENVNKIPYGMFAALKYAPSFAKANSTRKHKHETTAKCRTRCSTRRRMKSA